MYNISTHVELVVVIIIIIITIITVDEFGYTCVIIE